MTAIEKSADSNGMSNTQVPRRPPEIDKFLDDFLSMVCDTSRRYILELLTAQGEETPDKPQPEYRSGDIARYLGLSAATTSEHLKQLSKSGLITSRRDGNTVYYRLRNHKVVKAFQELLEVVDGDYRSSQA